MEALVLGVVLGLAIAAPVGPMAMLAVQATLARGVRHGLASALGAALGDGVYGAAAALGLPLLSGAAFAHPAALRLAGGAVLLGMGALELRQRGRPAREPAPGPSARSAQAQGLAAAGLAGFVLTATNPTTLMTFAALLLQVRSPASPALVTTGVIAGSLLWYAALCAAAHGLRARLERHLRLLGGVTIALFLLGGAFSVAAGVQLLLVGD